MKTSTFILAAILLSTGVIFAQDAKKPVTVRIKKVENVNGVSKITDTTFTVTDTKDLPKEISVTKITGSPGAGATVINIEGEDGPIRVEDLPDMEWVEAELAEGRAGAKTSKKIVLVECESGTAKDGDQRKSNRKQQTVIIVKKVMIDDPSENEIKQLGKGTKANTGLEVSQLDVAPNPSQGGITGITFFLTDRGATNIQVYNVEGKVVYEEHLPDFSGRYHKEIDLGGQSKGIYFLSVKQNDKQLTKKIILE